MKSKCAPTTGGRPGRPSSSMDLASLRLVSRSLRTEDSTEIDDITLPPHSATMDDCCRISELLFGAAPSGPVPITIGFVEITATADISVTAVYTAAGLQSGGVSIEVAQVAPNRG